MNITLNSSRSFQWKVEKIGVIGPGIVGMPMAALLAHARIRIGTDKPAVVQVVQRKSQNSGWKAEAINKGRSVIGGIEPDLDKITAESVKAGLLRASWDYSTLSDADLILVSIQTDRDGLGPDYGPLLGGLDSLARALRQKPDHKIPLVVFESTLAPSSMHTVIKKHFEQYGLEEGKDILLGNSPNRVMPGRLVERVTKSDKLVAGLHPETPRMIREVYRHIVTEGTLHLTNSLTAEVTKTLENAYRDVRIAFSAEIVRYCDEHNIDFFALRREVNKRLAQEDAAGDDPNAIPSGGLLIPMIGVGGHCLPKDGILLWWRKNQHQADSSNSLILHARTINDLAPGQTLHLFESSFGKQQPAKIAILGAAYRFNSEDTRNSPTFDFALKALEKGYRVMIHDPYVKPDDQNIRKYKLTNHFTNDIDRTLNEAQYIVTATAHKYYLENLNLLLSKTSGLEGILDACNAYKTSEVTSLGVRYAGIGKGVLSPSSDLTDFVYESFRLMERGIANEVNDLCNFLNKHYAGDQFNRVKFDTVQQLAASCSTGCKIVETGAIEKVPQYKGFRSKLVEKAFTSKLETTEK
jgi:UDP-N-acetyl-D-mannosaminuronic acid dehydrogenase